MKRFYEQVTCAPHSDGFLIHLDGKPVKTPAGVVLVTPSERLAAAIADEWRVQVDTIDPQTMPLTQILVTALERGQNDRPAIQAEVLGYVNTDLLCYHAAQPEALAEEQAQIWAPWLLWFRDKTGVALQTTTNLSALTQPAAAHAAVKDWLDRTKLWDFTAIQMVTGMSGSVILALAFVAGDASPEDVFHAAHIEEIYRSRFYNEGLHGQDPHHEKTQKAFMRDLSALRFFLNALD